MTQPPETSGAIGFLTAAALLRDLLVRKATGQLVAHRGEIIKKVFFKSGFVLYATSNVEADRLGNVLLARGMITRDQYEESASQVIATGRKQGTVLVQIGALTPKDLFRGLIAQVREIVVSMFGWDTGNWRFIEGPPYQEDIVSLRLNPAGLIFEGLALNAADPRWGGSWDLRWLDARPAVNAPFIIEELDAPEAARRLFALVEQGRPTGEMARLIGGEDREAASLLYGLTLLGMVDTRQLPANQPETEAAPAAQPAPQPAPEAAQSPAADDAETRQLRESVTSLAKRLGTLSHYQVLALTPESDDASIKRSYIALAKEYHPDRFFRPGFEDLQDAVNAIFLRVNEAYSTLHNPAARTEYDRTVLRVEPRMGGAPESQNNSRLAQEQFARGLAQLNEGDVWSAIQSLRWAVNLTPQNPRYHTWLGVALMRTKKRLHEAEEHCKTAIALDYNNAQYFVNLGLVYRTGHLYEKAKKQYETALRLDPKHPGALKEIRELEAASAPPPHEKGLFDRLRGK